MLFYSIVSITLALMFYTIGVWSEKNQGELKSWHLLMFILGLSFDVTGTTLMSMLSSESFQTNFHGVTGLAAIVLMFFHALWAAFVLIKNDKSAKESFHKFSLFVWLIWLIPYISGMMAGMCK